jgi:sucrose-6-phosphate hydrolase SacC (GH32 family)
MRFKLIILSLILAGIAAPAFAAEDIVIQDFEGGDYGEWKVEGDAFGSGPAKGKIAWQGPVTGFKGKGLVNTFRNADKSTGTLTSPAFRVERKYIKFLIGGGYHRNTCLELLVGGKPVAFSSGPADEKLIEDGFDVSKYMGKMVQVRIVDTNKGAWGHLSLDHIVQSNTPPKERKKLHIRAEEAYPEANYNQRHRPLFHFTSKKNWINDPNGMVHYDGEYHLFFQHNPKNVSWGNMTWGHAVSPDMMQWKQLKHAVRPYGGGTIWSGSGVVDHNNSLKKQTGDVKTLVVFFTLARKPYYQAMAYSTDKGRTFTLYNDGKAVLPNQGFDPMERDPMVFWHKESRKWVMVLWIKRAEPGTVRIFNSDDLVTWNKVSDFRRDWVFECMDLVKLPVRDEAGKPLGGKRNDMWLLYDADYDYEIGSFDGKVFKTDGKARKGDFGLNFYAAQSFNNSPDGRVVQMAWMRDSRFARLRMPFNQQMSVPTEMTLRKIDGMIKLYRWPVKEIANLYAKTHEIKPQKVSPGKNPLAGIEAEAFDMTLEFAPGSAREVRLRLRDAALTLDLGRMVLNGSTRKELPVRLIDRKVKLRILIDRASVEIFVNDGEYTATTFVVHKPENRKLDIQAVGGEIDIRKGTVTEIAAFWKSRQMKKGKTNIK